VRNVIAQKHPPSRSFQQVFLRDGERCWIVATERIQLLESEGNYTRVFFGENRPLIYKSLNALEERLDPAFFFRANRSHIINLREIKSLHPIEDGGFSAALNNGLRIEISRRSARRLKELLSL
jgi:two-component system LytT family response regulator